MMSSLATSSPVSASTLAYLMRWPVLRLIWLKLTFSVSDVAGKRATGQVTSERRKKPFQLARGAMGYSETQRTTTVKDTTGEAGFKASGGRILSTTLTVAVAARVGHGRASPGGRETRNVLRYRALPPTRGAARRWRHFGCLRLPWSPDGTIR